MSPARSLTSLLGAFMLVSLAATPAFAAPPISPSTSVSQTATVGDRSPHASLRLDVGRGKVWTGQSVPVTVTAYFRNVEGVTLEGAPQISSPGIFTSDLASEPRQTTEVIQGEPVLVATWAGTVTPAAPASLAVSVDLPVHIRYRVSAPRVEAASPFGQDPFDALGGNPFGAFGGSPFDTSFMNRFFNEAIQQEGPSQLREQELSLRATARPLDVLALPDADRPATFRGAVGRFGLSASVSSTRASVSEPLTLRVVVDGDGDLDRVDLAGVAASDAWKAYPPKSSLEPAARGVRARKVFEQVLVPLRGGTLSIPPVVLSSFDPKLGRYVTSETSALSVTVDGSAASASPAQPSATDSTPAPVAAALEAPAVPRVIPPKALIARLAPAVLLVLGAFVLSRSRRWRAARALRNAMRATAASGESGPFYRAAHTLIEARLSDRWGVRPEDVSAHAIRDHLGPPGDVLAEAILADEALRFGRGHLDRADLLGVCSSIERSLRGVS